MKNTKGMTLMEVMMAIFILSIAGLIITTGIAAVIRVMGDANTVKDQSDMLLSKAEKTDSDLDALVKETPSVLEKTTISNNFHNSVDVEYQITEYDMILNGKVSLKAFNFADTTVKDKIDDFQKKVNSFYSKVKGRATTGLAMASRSGGLNYIFNKTVIGPPPLDGPPPFTNEEDYIPYPSDLLPSAEKGTTYYLSAYYPWEHPFITSIPSNPLIYLSTYAGFRDFGEVNAVSEAIHFVYNYETESWYYNAGDDYKITYAYTDYYTKSIPTFSYKGKREILSWNEFKIHLSNSDWKKLDMDAQFNPGKPDDIWK